MLNVSGTHSIGGGDESNSGSKDNRKKYPREIKHGYMDLIHGTITFQLRSASNLNTSLTYGNVYFLCHELHDDQTPLRLWTQRHLQ